MAFAWSIAFTKRFQLATMQSGDATMKNQRRRATDRRRYPRSFSEERRSLLVWTVSEVTEYLSHQEDKLHFSEEYLNWWADLYEEERVAAQGVPFGIFIVHPVKFCRIFDISDLRIVGAPPEGFEMEPLLKVQREAPRRSPFDY